MRQADWVPYAGQTKVWTPKVQKLITDNKTLFGARPLEEQKFGNDQEDSSLTSGSKFDLTGQHLTQREAVEAECYDNLERVVEVRENTTVLFPIEELAESESSKHETCDASGQSNGIHESDRDHKRACRQQHGVYSLSIGTSEKPCSRCGCESTNKAYICAEKCGFTLCANC